MEILPRDFEVKGFREFGIDGKNMFQLVCDSASIMSLSNLENMYAGYMPLNIINNSIGSYFFWLVTKSDTKFNFSEEDAICRRLCKRQNAASGTVITMCSARGLPVKLLNRR